MCLSLAFDIRIASEAAYFRAAGINNGLTASEMGSQLPAPARDRLVAGVRDHAHRPRRRRRRSRRRWASSPRSSPGDELLDACYSVAERIIAWSRPGIELTKRSLWASLDAAQPVAAHEPGRRAAALRAHAHRQLRRSHPGAPREARAGLPRHPRLTTRRERTMPLEPRLSISLRTFAADDPGSWDHVIDRAPRRRRRRRRPGSSCPTTWCSARTSRRTGGPSSAVRRAASNPPAPTASGSSRSPRSPSSPAITTQIRLGTNILLAALRRPVVLAKTAATLDVLSGGRLDLGVGVGWQREEYDAAGLDFDGRGALLDHTLAVCQTLWREQRGSYVRRRRAAASTGSTRCRSPRRPVACRSG